jgi:hypothetical protein
VTAPRVRRLALSNGLTYNLLEWGAGRPSPSSWSGFLDLAWGWDEGAPALCPSTSRRRPDLRGHGDTDWIGCRQRYRYHFSTPRRSRRGGEPRPPP